MHTIDRFRGCLLGLACGDAVGTTVEFHAPGTFPPVTDMVGGGPFHLRKGEWTDDTSMALCLAASLVEQGGFDAQDQMQRFCRWKDQGYMSSNGRCFDIGMTVFESLMRFKASGNPYSGSDDPLSAGNGCIMRLAPVPMFFFADRAAAVEHSGHSARTTHAAQECVEASRLFGAMLHLALAGADKESILRGHDVRDLAAPGILAIADASYRRKQEREIHGSGYVVHSLEAALWCFAGTDSFEAAILRAANLGRDADTTAAICGQVAGAFYGEEGIPARWRESVAQAGMIRGLADALFAAAGCALLPFPEE